MMRLFCLFTSSLLCTPGAYAAGPSDSRVKTKSLPSIKSAALSRQDFEKKFLGPYKETAAMKAVKRLVLGKHFQAFSLDALPPAIKKFYVTPGKSIYTAFAQKGERWQNGCCPNGYPARRILYSVQATDTYVIAYQSCGDGISEAAHVFASSKSRTVDFYSIIPTASISTFSRLQRTLASNRFWLLSIPRKHSEPQNIKTDARPIEHRWPQHLRVCKPTPRTKICQIDYSRWQLEPSRLPKKWETHLKSGQKDESKP